MNLIVGSTGLLGMEICRQLLASGQPTRGLVRRSVDAGKRAELERLGATFAEGDLKEPASLRRACAGVHTVISTASSTFSRQEGDSIQTVDQAGQLALVEAAEAEGVKRFVFVSFRAQPQYPCSLAAAKLAVESRLKTSRMEHVILRASFFMEVWLTPTLGFSPLEGKVRIYGEGQNRISWVSYRDVARIAAAAARSAGIRSATLDVGGPEALSPREVVRIFEAAGAAEMACEFVSTAALESQYLAAADPMGKSFAALMLAYAKGDAMDMAPTMKLFPLSLTSVREYVSSVLAQREPAGARGS